MSQQENKDTLDDDVAPLINISLSQSDVHGGVATPSDLSSDLVAAFRNSGFLRISTPLVPLDLQRRALEAATLHLVQTPDTCTTTTSIARPGTEVVTHPTDPKLYCMLASPEDVASISSVLTEYTQALELTKIAVLRCLAAGLDLDINYFVRLHSENNSSLRLLRYPAGSAATGNRCKEHSDYGSITLLLTDGVSGLEAYHEGQWRPVPHAEGSLVVNAGSLLESWTNGKIPATLHRVAGPASENSCSPKEELMSAVGRDRTSLAYFADPDLSAKAALQQPEGEEQSDNIGNGDKVNVKDMSVAEYIRWRSGGDAADAKRSGLAFTEEEECRISGDNMRKKTD